jgi:putative ABC transport system substrate-binding protein
LHDLVPNAAVFALLINPKNPDSERRPEDVHKAASVLGKRLLILHASTASEIDTAFATLQQPHADALIVGSDPFFTGRREQFVALAARHAVPAMYFNREFAAAGGLMSYGNDVADGYHKAGVYAGRILKGAKPADLPVDQAVKFELVINLKTAKALGLTVSNAMQLLADEVIE